MEKFIRNDAPDKHGVSTMDRDDPTSYTRPTSSRYEDVNKKIGQRTGHSGLYGKLSLQRVNEMSYRMEIIFGIHVPQEFSLMQNDLRV
jgi:hypothetical protein